MLRRWLLAALFGTVGALAVLGLTLPGVGERTALAAGGAAAAGGVASEGGGHDWPQRRGANRDGISQDTGLLKKWPEGGPPLLYTFDGCGDGYCAPTIVGDRAYITGKFNNDAVMLAFDLPNAPEAKGAAGGAAGGAAKLLWKTKFGISCGSGENAAPVVAGDEVFTTSGNGEVAAFDLAGKLLWVHSMQKEFHAHIQTNSSYGFSESPLVDGDKVIVCPGTADAAMVAFNKNTGALLWQCANPNGNDRDAASHCSTMLSNAAGIKQYVNLTGWGLIGVSPEGKYLWGYKKTCESSIPTPIIRGDYVFALSSYGFGSVLLKLTSPNGDGVTPTVVWEKHGDDYENLCGQAVLIGDYLYFGHGKYAGVPTCLEFLTGKVMWHAEKQDGSGVAAMIAADGMLIFRNESKQVLLVEATPKGYNLVGDFKPVSLKRGYAPPVVAHGLLYLRDEGEVMVYDIRQK